MRLNEGNVANLFNRMGIALRWTFTSQNMLLIRAIISDRERQRSPMGMRLNERHRPALSVHKSDQATNSRDHL